jgi:ACS family tartrate transporter-like MFS transporter
MDGTIEKSAVRKVYLRLLPFAIPSYFLAYIDRINVSFAGLTMRGDLDMSATAFGFALALLGLLHLRGAEQPDHGKGGRAAVDRPHHDRLGPFGRRYRFGHRVDELCRRAIPGVADAGFFPGIILYFTYWFPSRHHARIVSGFLIGNPSLRSVRRSASSAAARLSSMRPAVARTSAKSPRNGV